jgi:hypothetical protein
MAGVDVAAGTGEGAARGVEAGRVMGGGDRVRVGSGDDDWELIEVASTRVATTVRPRKGDAVAEGVDETLRDD